MSGPQPTSGPVDWLSTRLRSRVGAVALAVRNRVSRAPVVDPDGGAVVSLTTYGDRARAVHLAIEAIGRGLDRPSRLILWLDDPVVFRQPGGPLERLRRRGLEIRLTENLGPHTKYYPYVEGHAGPFRSPLVTADDDVLYPRRWLRDLLRAHAADPTSIHCHRAHRIGVGDAGLEPYVAWQPWRGTGPSPLAFLTGVSGVIYPPTFLAELRDLGRRFVQVCPAADDVWLNWVALRTGHLVHQVRAEPRHFTTTPRTQATGLVHANVAGGGTDRWLALTYGPADVEVLRSAAGSTAPVARTRDAGGPGGSPAGA